MRELWECRGSSRWAIAAGTGAGTVHPACNPNKQKETDRAAAACWDNFNFGSWRLLRSSSEQAFLLQNDPPTLLG
jgi:hypothetical protein